MSNTFDKLSVLDSFIEEVNSYLPEIEANLDKLAETPGDTEALEETYRRTHTIGGSASMMDFPGLAHVAQGMEDILGDVLDNLATLDPPTIGLLRRSLARLHRLVDGIQQGIDEEAVIAEDDADYVQYRTLMESANRGNSQPLEPVANTTTPLAQDIALPSLDEMLASFRTPSAGEDTAWPEEPIPASNEQYESEQPTAPQPPVQVSPEAVQPSALEILAATARNVASPETPEDEPVEEQKATSPAPQPAQHSITVYEDEQAASLPVPATQVEGEISLPQAYEQVQQDSQVLEEQAASLRRTLAQLRQAASIIAEQRAEFKGFLDGSRDALDRMEEWAGKAMGLNLRNSPEQVRRFLPLSVMWVVNKKLKKVLELLAQMTEGVESTDEQLRINIQHLHASIEACGQAFEQLQTTGQLFTHDPGWTPWEMQVERDGDALRERVTFERRGDPVALRAEIEAEVREELRQEYESRFDTLAARAELEQQIRKEVREEFEARQRLQESVMGTNSRESLQELEARLRSEIEIEVRREFLQQLTGEVDNIDRTQATSLVQDAFMTPPAPPSGMPLSTSSIAPVEHHAPQTVSSSMATDFGEEAAEIFRLEAEEHLQTISMNVAALEKAPMDREPIQGIRRATHTLKGAAGMMGFRAIADLCHISEDLLDSIMEGSISISPSVLSIILDTAEALDLLINGKGAAGESERAVQSLRKRYTELLGEQSTQANVVEEEIEAEMEEQESSVLEEVAVTSVIGGEQQGAASGLVQQARSDLSVRVPLQKLDELVNLFGELLVNRSILEERLQRLMRLVADTSVSSNRLRDVGTKLESRFEAATLPSGRSVSVMPGEGDQSRSHSGNGRNARTEPAHLAEFDELELDRYTEFHMLARGLSEGISDMTTLSNEMEALIRDCEGIFNRENRLNTTFQDRLMKARLVPISTMIPRLYRTARAVALKQHKEFEFVVEGQETEVDRTVIEEIAGPLLHLIRNAVNHAIEMPEVRIQRGKLSAGQIKLSAAYEGNQVVITVRDDGTGIDPEAVRKAAIARNLIRPDQQLTDSDIIELLFRPGFSTAETLSEESGRGVGLDVVRDSVSRLRGTLEVETTPGQGTAFTMKFPTSLAIQSAMMVQVGEQQFAIPTVMVEAIGRLDTFKHTSVAGRPALLVQNETYPITSLGQLLNVPMNAPEDKAPVLLVRTDRHRVALVVDDIRGKMDVVMKNLGPHLRHVHGIAGGTVLGNGRVVLILELVELLSMQGNVSMPISILGSTTVSAPRESKPVPAQQSELARASISAPVAPPERRSSVMATSTPPRQPQAAPRGKHVLVVDDSPSVRRVVGNMLKQNGWEVQLARDGVEALEMISRETPAAVLLDIEMPRMDGYELMATVRAQEQYRTLPLVVLTSRAAAKHQQRAMQIGANAYVVKPYQDEELLNTLKSLVYGATV
ncbi:MAG TPA: response regulator [Ktedonobacteraceae bacterium]|jgi:chemotaxis protein histidine kinase CheA/ActR/RegA family two-component response regulator|nr:response regulator [Ktedonobacteraceae bacterium]